jgi:hypothetical protein
LLMIISIFMVIICWRVRRRRRFEDKFY